jgi:uncharacterized FAD-dependent dehydrogenase
MLRITELRLPLDHAEPALRAAVLARLGLPMRSCRASRLPPRLGRAQEVGHRADLHRRLRWPMADEAAVLAALCRRPARPPQPDTRYRFVGHAPADFQRRRAAAAGGGGLRALRHVRGADPGADGPAPHRAGARQGVRERTKDTWGLWRQGVLDPESNVQFGEGGAGTFSDGKLWSQISDPRHLTRKVLTEFVQGRRAGGDPVRQQAAHRHLPPGQHGREDARRDRGAGRRDPLRPAGDRPADRGGHMRGLVLASGEQLRTDHVVLALGHSARDTFAMLQQRGVFMEAKPFSVGFRIEHPQGVIDRARFGPNAGHPILGAADYKLVHHASNGRSVYSFCMCPGGTVVAATSEPGRVVTNGMSQYSRNERNANAGIVVGISPPTTGRTAGRRPGLPLDGMAFQRQWESRAYELGGGGYQAPGQLVGDFIKGQRASRRWATWSRRTSPACT